MPNMFPSKGFGGVHPDLVTRKLPALRLLTTW
jgi:hypothetical protein